MTLLIDIRAPQWMRDQALRDLLAPHLPGVEILCGPPTEPLPSVLAVATNQLQPDVAPMLPNLRLVQKLGAGVETMLTDPNLPQHVRIARLEPSVQADEIAEYCLAELLAELRNIRGYLHDQKAGHWHGEAPRRAAETSVLVLGLGHIGRRVAERLALNGFQTSGWSRTQKSIPAINCYCGETDLKLALGRSDFVISVLPSTAETRGLANADMFGAMKPGAVFLNVGRGDLVVEADLIEALNSGHLGGAALDVFHVEPLPQDHPFWTHDKITVTPHVSGWSLGEGLLDVAENYKRLVAGQPLLREINRKTGY
jgi:glyoxylate/hydroxypyruvate reductase A